jgi:hypothetical protein
VQRDGASDTLTGMRFRLQTSEICMPVLVSICLNFLADYLLAGSRGFKVMKTASTTLPISSLPS